VNRIKSDVVDVMIGFGNYKFKFEEHDIEIIYAQEGTPKPLEHFIDYYKKLTLVADDEEIVKNFLKAAMNDKDNLALTTETTDIFITNEYGDWLLYNKIPSRKLDSIYIEDEIKSKIIKDLEDFKKSEEEYNKFGIPYKRTYLLTGSPGTGKTSLIKAICSKYNYSLSMLSISKNFDNASLMNCLKDLPENTVLLLEDIDSLFEKRSVSNENPLLTFSNLINILDGVLYKHGVIIFMTTNHPEKLDHALLRMGRIDLIIEINYPDKENIRKVFIDLLKSDDFGKFYEYVKNKKIPMCAIVNFLFRYRIDWENNIDELINTDNFIKKTLKQERSDAMYC
jgi:chaperone BCS1